LLRRKVPKSIEVSIYEQLGKLTTYSAPLRRVLIASMSSCKSFSDITGPDEGLDERMGGVSGRGDGEVDMVGIGGEWWSGERGGLCANASLIIVT
jgi:hypothetical protein